MTTYTIDELMRDIPAEQAERAYSGTSFDPEKRGASLRREYAQRVLDFADYLEESADEASEQQKSDELARYRANMRNAYLHYVSCHSRCISSFITGGSNFPVRRAEKANNAEHNAYKAIMDLEEKARKSVRKRYYNDPNAPIRSEDPNALEKLRKKLDSCKRFQESMKTANKAIREAKGNRELAIQKLRELGFSEKIVSDIMTPDFLGRIGYASFHLSNNNQEIHRLERRIRDVKALQSRPEEKAQNEDGIRYEVDNTANRVKLFFPDKPSEEVRTNLKRNGFRWSPRNCAWQAYISNYTISFAKELVGETTES